MTMSRRSFTTLVGATAYTQAFELTPGINAFDVGFSNVLELRLGY